MTHEELHHWIIGFWKESSMRRLLVLDNYYPHLEADTISLAESMDTDTCYVPGLEAAQASLSQWICPPTLL